MDALLIQLRLALAAPQTAPQQAATEELIAALETGTVPWADVSPDFKDAHELPARDMGIDSASEEVAVQTKFRPQSGRVGAREIAMFLTSARLGPRPFGRCILATQDGVRLPTYRKSEYERLDINQAIRDKWATRAARESVGLGVRAPVVLRDYQREAIACVLDRLHAPPEELAADADDGRSSSADSEPGDGVRQVRIKLPCGSGKSLVMAHVVRAAVGEGKRAVALVPTLALLDQMSALFAECGIRHGLRGTDHNGGGDCAAEEEVMISVYNSAAYLRGPFDLIVVDEAHHLAVPEVYADDPGRSPTLWREVRRLIEAGGENRPLLAMFSATLDGADFERNTGDLITGGVLADYDIWVPVWDRNPEARDIAEYVAENIGALRSTLIYSNRLEKARAISDALCSLGIRCAYFDGESGRAERRRILGALRSGEIQALSTVGVVAEGADLPGVNACVFADPRESQIAIVQCVGRALRKAPGKIMAHVAIPCVCASLNQGDESGLRELGKIMRAMSGEDSRIRRCIARRSARVSVRACATDNSLEENAVENAELISEYVYDRMGNMVRCGFERNLDILQRFVSANSRLPTRKEEYGGVKIGAWINTVRMARKGKGNCPMTPERIRALESIPGWSWEAKTADEMFADNVALLRRFVSANSRLPTRKEEYEGVKIGKWINTVRTARKGKGKSLITPERAHALESIPGWSWEAKTADEMFADNVALLQRFVSANSRLPTSKEEYEGVKIGTWISNLRTARKGKSSHLMTPERARALESIPGWSWEAKTADEIFADNVALLQRFVSANSRLPTCREECEGVKIGSWISAMRTARKGKSSHLMTPERARALESIPGWKWSVR